MKAFNILLISFFIGLSSCTYNLTPFTTRVQSNANLQEQQLKNIQFYISNDIVLYRAITNHDTQIDKGELKIVNGQQIEEVVIKAGTPGVVVGISSAKELLISFDLSGHFLRFGANQNSGGRYTLMAKNWESTIGILDYGGIEFKATPESIYAYLQINLDQTKSITIDSKEATGRTLSP